jgi:uncharacterized membrane protein
MSGEPDSFDRLERRLGRILTVGSAASAALLALGVLFTLAGLWAGAAALLLHVGLVVLMATPVLRVLVSFAEYVWVRDWFFALTTLAVLAVLAVTLLVALDTAG